MAQIARPALRKRRLFYPCIVLLLGQCYWPVEKFTNFERFTKHLTLELFESEMNLGKPVMYAYSGRNWMGDGCSIEFFALSSDQLRVAQMAMSKPRLPLNPEIKKQLEIRAERRLEAWEIWHEKKWRRKPMQKLDRDINESVMFCGEPPDQILEKYQDILGKEDFYYSMLYKLGPMGNVSNAVINILVPKQMILIHARGDT